MCSQSGFDRVSAQLAQCEFAVTKSDFASKMMKQELRNYESISKTIDTGIDQAKAQIEQSKENLVLAKKIRKNRMEYDALAKIITQQPDRKKTTEQLDSLKRELNELDNSNRQLQRKLEIRSNEFSVLMRSIKELQAKLDDENGVAERADDTDTSPPVHKADSLSSVESDHLMEVADDDDAVSQETVPELSNGYNLIESVDLGDDSME